MSSCGIITHYIFSIAFLQKKKTAHVEVVAFYAEVVMRISPVATSLRLIQQTILPHKKVSLLKSKVYHEVLIDHFKHFLELIVSLDDAKSTASFDAVHKIKANSKFLFYLSNTVFY